MPVSSLDTREEVAPLQLLEEEGMDMTRYLLRQPTLAGLKGNELAKARSDLFDDWHMKLLSQKTKRTFLTSVKSFLAYCSGHEMSPFTRLDSGKQQLDGMAFESLCLFITEPHENGKYYKYNTVMEYIRRLRRWFARNGIESCDVAGTLASLDRCKTLQNAVSCEETRANIVSNGLFRLTLIRSQVEEQNFNFLHLW